MCCPDHNCPNTGALRAYFRLPGKEVHEQPEIVADVNGDGNGCPVPGSASRIQEALTTGAAQIAPRAYEIFKTRRRQDGRDQEDRLDAE